MSKAYKSYGIGRGKAYVHRRVAEGLFGAIPKGMVVDHINGDKHDNRPENLRVVSHSLNHLNTGPRETNTSGFKGVTRNRTKWKAEVCWNGETKYLGAFETPEEAADAYDNFVLAITPLIWTNRNGYPKT